ncbi:MAG TPA: LSM domain-containing protein [Candidatus Thermoplasmatota archaeon]|nr:LSM domain-containing protein [Candidatus Thermoplasmatota archaeon]
MPPEKGPRKRPLDVLNATLNARVIVQVRGQKEYRGVLDGYDHPHMNLVLKNAEEVQHAGTPEETTQRHDLIILRGDNIIFISP